MVQRWGRTGLDADKDEAGPGATVLDNVRRREVGYVAPHKILAASIERAQATDLWNKTHG